MAILREYRDGGFYIVRGFPFKTSRGEKDVFFSTMQVLPRGQRFFEQAGYRDGRQIEAEVFYSLALDGDISSPGMQGRKVSIDSLPANVFYTARSLSRSQELVGFLKETQISRARYLAEFYSEFQRLKPQTTTSFAAYTCLARHLRQADYEKRILQ